MAVVLVTIDGLAPRFAGPERTPALWRLARSGAACFEARTVAPPLTVPVHASILRGVDPDTHGLHDNTLGATPSAAPSVFSCARQAGLGAAAVTSWTRLDDLIEADALSHRLAIDSGYDPTDDDLVVDLTSGLLRNQRPDLTYVYLVGPDLAGHAHGWGSAPYLDAVAAADGHLGRLIGLLEPEDHIIVATDHGGVGESHTSTAPDVMDVFIVIRSARLPAAAVWPSASVLDIAPTVVDLLDIATPPEWQGRTLLGRERPLLDHVLDLLRETANQTYGEDLTMLDHALQAAARAEEDGADDDLVVAALLHDLGHLMGPAGPHGYADHGEAAARWLSPWLPRTVTEPIRLHIAAKRHLVASDPSYANLLSAASRVTLEEQGGSFDGHESASFLQERHCHRALRLRSYDDRGKSPGLAVPGVAHYRPRIEAAFAGGAVDPAWARDACRCPECRDPESDQHLIDIHDTQHWDVLGVRRRSDHLSVDLARGTETHTAEIPSCRDEVRSRRRPWPPEMDLDCRRRRAGETEAIATDVATTGIALVTGLDVQSGAVLRFATTLGFVRETNYGRLFDVRAEASPTNLAYSSTPLPLHTDNPYRDPVPTIQILHCLQPAALGGATRLTDGLAAAEDLRRDLPKAFDALATTALQFRFRDAAVDLRAERPVIDVAPDGRIRSVAVNHRSLHTPVSTAVGSALAAFAERLEARAIDIDLGPGDAIVFDNRRVLHGRTGFDCQSGRHLQGCYVDIDALDSHARRAGSPTVAIQLPDRTGR